MLLREVWETGECGCAAGDRDCGSAGSVSLKLRIM